MAHFLSVMLVCVMGQEDAIYDLEERPASAPRNWDVGRMERVDWLPGSPVVVGDLMEGGNKPIVIFWHGLGENVERRLGWMQELAYERGLGTFVHPEAPPRHMPLQGTVMSSWFVIKDPYERRPAQLEGFEEMRKQAHDLIKTLQPLGRKILLCGYSQGSAIAIASGKASRIALAEYWEFSFKSV